MFVYTNQQLSATKSKQQLFKQMPTPFLRWYYLLVKLYVRMYLSHVCMHTNKLVYMFTCVCTTRMLIYWRFIKTTIDIKRFTFNVLADILSVGRISGFHILQPYKTFKVILVIIHFWPQFFTRLPNSFQS